MPNWRVKLLYDGKCSFCRREVEWLKGRDRNGRIALEDIADPAFDPARYGLTKEDVTAVLHAVTRDGRIVTRTKAIQEAYRAIGRGWMAAPVGWPVVHSIADRLYGLFARSRMPLGRLCGRCCGADSCTRERPRS